jgi:signal transduction histidine kinase
MLRGLRTQIFLWTILPLALILIGVAYVGVVSHQRAMREMVAERDGALAEASAARISELLDDHLQHLENVDIAHPESWDTHIFDGGLALYDSQRNVLAAVPSRTVWETRSKNLPSGNISRPFFENGNWYVLIARTEDDQRLVGAVALPAFKSIAPRGTPYLVDAQGTIIAHPDASRVGENLRAHEGIAQVTRGEAGATFHHDAAGNELVVGYAPIAPAEWGLLIDESWGDVVEPLFQFSILLPVVLAIVGVVALIAIYFGVRYVIRPLQQLSVAANRIAFGDYTAAEKHVGGAREIEELRETLDAMAKQVHTAQEAMQHYIGAVTQGQEEERKRLARELHDDTIQSLIALQQRIELTRKALAKDPRTAATKLNELKMLTGETLGQVRGFVRDLRPTYLEELGLIPSLEMLAQEAKATFQVQGEEQRLDAERELALYRITQEALRNTGKHARATKVNVTVTFRPAEVTVEILDNGVGFDAPATPGAYAQAGHFGLTGMQERAQLFGGNVYVQSEPGKGTRLIAYVPLTFSVQSHAQKGTLQLGDG